MVYWDIYTGVVWPPWVYLPICRVHLPTMVLRYTLPTMVLRYTPTMVPGYIPTMVPGYIHTPGRHIYRYSLSHRGFTGVLGGYSRVLGSYSRLFQVIPAYKSLLTRLKPRVIPSRDLCLTMANIVVHRCGNVGKGSRNRLRNEQKVNNQAGL